MTQADLAVITDQARPDEERAAYYFRHIPDSLLAAWVKNYRIGLGLQDPDPTELQSLRKEAPAPRLFADYMRPAMISGLQLAERELASRSQLKLFTQNPQQ